MHRLAFRPLLRALRVQRPPLSAVRSTRLASTTSSDTTPNGTEPAPGTRSPQPSASTKAQSRVRINAKSSLDPAGLYTPAEYVDAQLKSPQVQEFIKTLSPEDYETYEFISSQLSKENGHSNPAALNDIGEFFEQRGVDLDLPDVLFESTDDTVYPDYRPHPEHHELSITDPETKEVKTFHGIVDPIPSLDDRSIFRIPPSKSNPYGGKVTTYNGISIFDSSSSSSSSRNTGKDKDTPPIFIKTAPSGAFTTPAQNALMDKFYTSVLLSRRVVHQTGKGKVRSHWYLVLTGNGNGLVGYGQGKHAKPRIALQQARAAAIKNIDSVERFEERTVWTEMSAKLGATKLVLRPRPVGFGLRCNPSLHQVLRAAGFKDISAKVWGSRNKMNVVKCAFMLLQAGHAPPGMGDGVGGKGVKLSRGVGMMGKIQMERARGRKLISLRK